MRFPQFLLILLCGSGTYCCISTETGNPWKKDEPGDSPTLRSVPLRLSIHSGVSGAQSQLTELNWELVEMESIGCEDQSIVTSFAQASGWGSGNEEEALLPEATLCRLIVRGAVLEQNDDASTRPGAFIQGTTEEGAFRLMVPAPTGSVLRMVDGEIDLTSFQDLRFEVSEERLMSSIESLLADDNTRAELLQPGSQATHRLSEELGNSLELVNGEDAERRVLATSAESDPLFLCDDYCRASTRSECNETCDLAACQQELADDSCGAAFEDWLGCLVRSESQQLSCESGTLENEAQLCSAQRNEYDACGAGGGQ